MNVKVHRIQTVRMTRYNNNVSLFPTSNSLIDSNNYTRPLYVFCKTKSICYTVHTVKRVRFFADRLSTIFLTKSIISANSGPEKDLRMAQNPGVRFTTRCRALTAGLSLTLNLTTNSTIPVSQPLSCVSLSCANLSLSLTLQISQWSSSIETTSSDYRFSGVNRELQVLNVSGFIKFKSKHQSFSQADHI